MQQKTTHVIDSVVKRGLCSGCGVCAGVCPLGALTMQFTTSGDLAPQISGTCQGHCGTCTEVCPFAAQMHDPRYDNQVLFGPGAAPQVEPLFHEDVGWYLGAVVGFSAEHRPTSASGGLLSACLEYLLQTGEIDRAAVVGPTTVAGQLGFAFRVISSKEEVRTCAGSVYYPIEISSLVRDIGARSDGHWAVVGVPCLCSALRKASRRIFRIGKAIKYILGLACGSYQNRFYTEFLCQASGIPLSKAGKIEYRIKSTVPPASNYGFRVTSVEGVEGKLLHYHGLPLFLGLNGYFRCNACNFCKDVFAESADACFMDAWAAPYHDDPRGTSIVVFRNASLHTLFARMPNTIPGLRIVPVPIEILLSSQSSQIHRKRRLIQMRMHGGDNTTSLWDHLEWHLQQCTLRRSKSAWERYGRNRGLAAFWLAMADLWLLQRLYPLARKLEFRLVQLVRNRTGFLRRLLV